MSLSNSACPICFLPLCANTVVEGRSRKSALKDLSLSSTFCGHCFHTSCISKALRYANRCPTCRKVQKLSNVHPLYLELGSDQIKEPEKNQVGSERPSVDQPMVKTLQHTLEERVQTIASLQEANQLQSEELLAIRSKLHYMESNTNALTKEMLTAQQLVATLREEKSDLEQRFEKMNAIYLGMRFTEGEDHTLLRLGLRNLSPQVAECIIATRRMLDQSRRDLVLLRTQYQQIKRENERLYLQIRKYKDHANPQGRVASGTQIIGYDLTTKALQRVEEWQQCVERLPPIEFPSDDDFGINSSENQETHEARGKENFGNLTWKGSKHQTLNSHPPSITFSAINDSNVSRSQQADKKTENETCPRANIDDLFSEYEERASKKRAKKKSTVNTSAPFLPPSPVCTNSNFLQHHTLAPKFSKIYIDVDEGGGMLGSSASLIPYNFISPAVSNRSPVHLRDSAPQSPASDARLMETLMMANEKSGEKRGHASQPSSPKTPSRVTSPSISKEQAKRSQLPAMNIRIGSFTHQNTCEADPREPKAEEGHNPSMIDFSTPPRQLVAM